MGKTMRYNNGEGGRVPPGTKKFLNKKDMIKYLENLKWREHSESAKGNEELRPIDTDANIQRHPQKNQKN